MSLYLNTSAEREATYQHTLPHLHSSRLYLRIRRNGYEQDVAVVRHNRITTEQGQSALASIHARLFCMTMHALPVPHASRSETVVGAGGGAEAVAMGGEAKQKRQEGSGGVGVVGEFRASVHWMAASGKDVFALSEAESLAVGLVLRQSGTGEWVVAHVEARKAVESVGSDEVVGEEASKASEIEEGDVVCEVDGVELKDFGIFDVLYLLDGPAAAETAILKVHR
jgi:hypothetical protein